MTLRVAAYCRVSTDKEDQQSSFESQKAFFGEYITRRPDWTMAGIYADEGITGTSAIRRVGFLQMIADAKAGCFDRIVTKEVSRFSRNILDAVAYTRELKAYGVGVDFLNDGISTLDPDAELRLGIMASVAQEESRKTSQRVRWGQHRSMERGIVFGPSLLGYTVKNGRIDIEPCGAELVQTIFALYVYENLGARAIAGTLTLRGVPTPTDKTVWSPVTILKILKNEKYCGDLTQRKTVTQDYLTHIKIVNRDEAALIRIKDHHEPIIERPLWEAAQAELQRRASSGTASVGHGNRYPLSGKIKCAKCGAVFTCRTRKRNNGGSYRMWCGSCSDFLGAHVYFREELLTDCVKKIVASVAETGPFADFNDMLSRLEPDHKARETSLRREISRYESKRLRLADAFISEDISREDYLPLKSRIEDTLKRLHENLLTTGDDKKDDTGEIAAYAALLVSGRGEPDFYLELVNNIHILRADKIAIFLKNAIGSSTVFLTG